VERSRPVPVIDAEPVTEPEPGEIEEAEPDAGKPDRDQPPPRRRSRTTIRRRPPADTALRRLRRSVVALAIAVLLAAVLAGTAWFNHQRAERRDTAIRESTAAATAAAQAIFSYDYRTFDASVANGKSFVTGEFADEYTQTTTSLKSAATAEQAVVHAQVSAIAVINATTDHVELLLYLNQYRRNVNIAGEKVDQNRVVLTMVRTGGEWKVVKAAAV
jgi:Mce-associated membrane protein